MWANIAVSLSNAADGKLAIETRDMIAKQLKPKQIAQAQEMARVCLASTYTKCD
jgi:hypothetical protein